MDKPTRKNWEIKEIGTLPMLSETCLLMVDPSADIISFTQCCEALESPEIKHVHIVFNNYCSPRQVKAFLKIVKAMIPKRAYTVKHASPRVVALMELLWRKGQAETRKGNDKRCQSLKT